GRVRPAAGGRGGGELREVGEPGRVGTGVHPDERGVRAAAVVRAVRAGRAGAGAGGAEPTRRFAGGGGARRAARRGRGAGAAGADVGAADVGAAEVSKGPATASATRMLVYATAMSQARRRVARCLATTRRVSVRGLEGAAQVAAALVQIGDDLEEIGRWLEEFHPHSLVE